MTPAEAAGSGDWATAFEKALTLVSNMTLEEKVCILPAIQRGT